MKKTEGKRTSVAEYVRKRAYGESAGPGKKEVLPVCEKSAQQEEVKSDLELLQACCKKEKYFLEMFRKASGSNVTGDPGADRGEGSRRAEGTDPTTAHEE